MSLTATIQTALSAHAERLAMRQERIMAALASQNDGQRANVDCNGRLHAPFDGYQVDEAVYAKGEFIKDSIDDIEAKEIAGMTASNRSYAFKARHLIASQDAELITSLVGGSVLTVGFGKAFDGQCYAYFESSVKSIVDAIKASEEERKTSAQDAAKTGVAPTGRVAVTAVVLSIKIVDGMHGYQQKMLVKFDDGATAFGTVPAAISDVKLGDSVTFTATFKTTQKDTTHAFFSRPTKAEIVEIETIENNAQDEPDDTMNAITGTVPEIETSVTYTCAERAKITCDRLDDAGVEYTVSFEKELTAKLLQFSLPVGILSREEISTCYNLGMTVDQAYCVASDLHCDPELAFNEALEYNF